MSVHDNQSKCKTTTDQIRKDRFHSKLSDVGLYCVGGLCAVSLSQLFYEQCQSAFKKSALEKILHDLGQPKQTNESMFAMLDGEIISDCNAFVDTLTHEEGLKDSRQPIVTDLISLAIKDGCYDARMRVLIKHIAWQLRVTWDEVETIEEDMAETLEYNKYVMSEEEVTEKEKKLRSRKVKRYALIGLATVGGGALIGLTGGLAAPLVAVGAGAIIGGAGAAALGSAAGVAIIGSLFGVAGAGLTGYKMKRRVGAVDEFCFEPLTVIGSKRDSQQTIKQLHITIAVTGWLNDKTQDFRIPWSALAESKEQYSLRWESQYLFQLGQAFDYLWQTGLSVATTEALKYTILAGIITAIAWPAALIGAAGAIDNPWHVCTQRATEAGKQLAEVLLGREQGNRPVTLIGFSLGARVIFSCLEELTKRKGGEGLIEDVILLGAPISGDPKYWKPLTKVVAGKIVNGYARGDWLLKFLFRTGSVTLRVAGLAPVKWDNRRMHNIDLSDIIDGHGDYNKNLDIIMKAVGVRTKDELNITGIRTAKATSKPAVYNDSKTDNESESETVSQSHSKANDVSPCDSENQHVSQGHSGEQYEIDATTDICNDNKPSNADSEAGLQLNQESVDFQSATRKENSGTKQTKECDNHSVYTNEVTLINQSCQGELTMSSHGISVPCLQNHSSSAAQCEKDESMMEGLTEGVEKEKDIGHESVDTTVTNREDTEENIPKSTGRVHSDDTAITNREDVDDIIPKNIDKIDSDAKAVSNRRDAENIIPKSTAIVGDTDDRTLQLKKNGEILKSGDNHSNTEEKDADNAGCYFTDSEPDLEED